MLFLSFLVVLKPPRILEVHLEFDSSVRVIVAVVKDAWLLNLVLAHRGEGVRLPCR